MPAELPQAFFLPARSGQRYCAVFRPSQAALGQVLFLHPFAEEMNASRRVAAQQSRAMASAGYTVMLMDLYGCGDSSNDFSEATWDEWLSDVDLGLQWLAQDAQGQPSPQWLWGLRAGALLACDAVSRRVQGGQQQTPNLLFWAPPASGHQQLQQFMRLHAAAQWLGGTASSEAPPLALAAGRNAHIAGYSLSPTLANGLESATLSLPRSATGRVEVIEMMQAPSSAVSGMSAWMEKQAGTWRESGWDVRLQSVVTPHFWLSVADSELSPELSHATISALA